MMKEKREWYDTGYRKGRFDEAASKKYKEIKVKENRKDNQLMKKGWILLKKELWKQKKYVRGHWIDARNHQNQKMRAWGKFDIEEAIRRLGK